MLPFSFTIVDWPRLAKNCRKNLQLLAVSREKIGGGSSPAAAEHPVGPQLLSDCCVRASKLAQLPSTQEPSRPMSMCERWRDVRGHDRRPRARPRHGAPSKSTRSRPRASPSTPPPPAPLLSLIREGRPRARATPIRRWCAAPSQARRGRGASRAAEPDPPRAHHQSGEWGRGAGARHGGHARRRRIGIEGRRRGRRPGRRLGLGRHPAAPLLRLPLPLLRSRGCFGCCDKAVKRLGELSRNLITHDEIPIGEPFWSTTTIEVEPADLRGVSSNWGFDQHGTGSSHNLPGNNGVVLWEQTRQEWTEIRSLRPKVKQVREPVLSWNAAYESLLGSNKPFAQPIPLHEMVDFLVDIWEQEGLYD